MGEAGGGVRSTMQLVSWATLLTLLVPDLVEMRSPDSAAAVRKDRLHPRQGNMALDPQAPPHAPTHSISTSLNTLWGGHPAVEASLLFLERITSRFGTSPFSGSSLVNY